jgi:hypothetical protein
MQPMLGFWLKVAPHRAGANDQATMIGFITDPQHEPKSLW